MRRTGWLRAVRGAGERGEAGRDGSRALLYNHLVKIGLIGLAKSGKTTLFNLLTGASVATSRYDSGRAELHTGVARVPDPRVDRLAALFKPKKTTYATFEVVDLAGIAKGERQGLEAKEFRNADALLHVVRAFPDATGAAADPGGDIDDLETELILADLEVVERRLERLEAQIKKKRTDADVHEQAVLLKVKPLLESERPIRAMGLGDDEARALRGFTFLSEKPILHCLNLSEKEIARGATLVESFGLQAVAQRPATRLGWVSAVIEAEVAQLEGPEQAAFLADLGLSEPAIGRVLQDCYALLGLISFFTVGEDEVRAWSIPRATRAQDAAGAIHSDIARGFIRAEVVGYDDLLAADGSMATARERGRFRLEGKDYEVQDGEICHFRFNVGGR
jgi:GTP-binding protein YchF